MKTSEDGIRFKKIVGEKKGKDGEGNWGTQDVGKKGGLLRTACKVKKGKNRGKWITQRYLLSKDNVKIGKDPKTGRKTLQGTNARGRKEIKDIEKKHGKIVKKRGKSFEFRTSN